MSLGRKIIKVAGAIIGWALILMGTISVAFSFAAIVPLIQGATPGAPVYFDETVPTYTEAIQMILISVLYLLIGIGIRYLSAKGFLAAYSSRLRFVR